MLCMLSEKLASVQKKIDKALALRKEKKVTGDTVTILAFREETAEGIKRSHSL